MINMTVNRPTKPLNQIPATLRSEGEVNRFMEWFGKAYEAPDSKIDDVMAMRVYRAAKTQLHLLRFRGAA